ncbi:NACHT domain-containing protein [Actinoplanes sp. CA-015351]|uniref:NACHT domain-containing protein n=1 Tax=Actinoplanes sp. CA-015351 TaxID=3239897 RepID=UPI003D9705C0
MKRGSQLVLSVLGVALLGAATNIATGVLPETWEPYLWLAWPAAVVLVITLIVVELRGRDEPAAPDVRHPEVARRILIDRVRRYWIENLLERSLYQEARIELDLTATIHTGGHPWDIAVARPDGAAVAFPPGTGMAVIFDRLDRNVVILGDPGSGKTTMLLELARTLLERADQDRTSPVPVVLPLAAWATRRQPIAEWIVEQLTEQYRMPRTLAAEWVTSQNILPLFDGLDEVAAEHRDACATAINRFHADHTLVGSALCCRADEYRTLKARVAYYGTVVIAPLTRPQLEAYLDRAGDRLRHVRAALDADAQLWELAGSPLLLSVMMLAYGSDPVPGQAGRRGLYQQYVRIMLRRRADPRYPARRAAGYLAALAENLTSGSQTVVTLDSVTDDWSVDVLLWQLNRLAKIVGVIVSIGLSAAIGGNLLGVPGAFGAAAFAALLILPYFYRRFGYSELGTLVFPEERRRSIEADLPALPNESLPSAVFSTFLFGLSIREQRPPFLAAGVAAAAGLFLGVRNSLGLGLIYGLGAAAIVLLASLVTMEVGWRLVDLPLRSGRVRTEVPSPRLRACLRYASGVAAMTGAICGTIAGAVASLAELPRTWTGGLIVTTTFVVLICGIMSGGGTQTIEQYLMRRALAYRQVVPRPYLPFLDYMVQCLQLRQVGADSYIFVHRELMEFLAEHANNDMAIGELLA